MKKHTTIKSIKANYNKVFFTPYCSLEHLQACCNPKYYNSGIYGWNCDIYTNENRSIAICTGYRNMAWKRIPTELIQQYSNAAKNAIKTLNGEQLPKALSEIWRDFCGSLDGLQ